MATAIETLEQEAREIQERISPKQEEIRADEERLARLRAAISMLKGEVALSIRSRHSAPRRDTRGRQEIPEDQIIAYVGQQGGQVSGAAIRKHLGIDAERSNSVSVKLGRMVERGQLAAQGERRSKTYTLPGKA